MNAHYVTLMNAPDDGRAEVSKRKDERLPQSGSLPSTTYYKGS